MKCVVSECLRSPTVLFMSGFAQNLGSTEWNVDFLLFFVTLRIHKTQIQVRPCLFEHFSRSSAVEFLNEK